jgi:deoxyribodipyrimidine photo-lyase
MAAIWWIRRDLRLDDNPALWAALEASPTIIPLFILDPFFERSAYVGKSRLDFLYANIDWLDQALQGRGGRLIIQEGEPLSVLTKLVADAGATAIFAQEDHSPYARARDRTIQKQLPLSLTDGLTIHPPAAVHKLDGTPYTVFTPYSKTWKSLPLPTGTLPIPDKVTVPEGINSIPLPSYSSISDPSLFPPGETEAQARLRTFTEEAGAPIHAYHEERNRMDLQGTSSLSPYLRFGILSPRQAVLDAQRAMQHTEGNKGQKGAQTWLNELIWREFFISILHNFPQVRRQSFREDLRGIQWRNDPDEFRAWKEGLTGYPIVDAAMRQLLKTGWMHNRARMIVASFLVKDLLIDWRWGERWFMQNLLDGDPAANNGGWQWSAGTGTDAAPYFRIFNPILQSKKFDPQGDYIRRWVPELSALSTPQIHAPWELASPDQKKFGVQIGKSYPEPIVDHRIARERTLAAFKAAKESG